jgi:acetoin utilization protein AcuB
MTSLFLARPVLFQSTGQGPGKELFMIKRANEAMSGKLITIGWNDSMAAAFQLMESHRLRHLPVLDESGNTLGILSDRDVQRAMKTELRWSESIQQKVPSFESVEFDPDAKVRHYMSWPVKSVDYHTDLRLVAGMMVSDKISAMLVTKNDRHVGIVTTEDLLKVLMSLLGGSQERKPIGLDTILARHGHFGYSW